MHNQVTYNSGRLLNFDSTVLYFLKKSVHKSKHWDFKVGQIYIFILENYKRHFGRFFCIGPNHAVQFV